MAKQQPKSRPSREAGGMAAHARNAFNALTGDPFSKHAAKETMYGSDGVSVREGARDVLQQRASNAIEQADSKFGKTPLTQKFDEKLRKDADGMADRFGSKRAAIDDLIVRSRGQTQLRDSDGRTKTFQKPERTERAPEPSLGDKVVKGLTNAATELGKGAASLHARVAAGAGSMKNPNAPAKPQYADEGEHNDPGSGSKRGFANARNQAAAQKAKGNNYSGPSE